MTAQTNNPKEIRVQAIKNGTVIDHLPAGFGLLVSLNGIASTTFRNAT
ncbi:MAG: hypothetical protein HY981_03990 [Candidatus Magasanikbacteria bacterium]|nr:hypothetical protein [Candidatus Magasanikbacteria bacterium]